MDLSPNDIRNLQLGTQMRGYAKEEVDNFREQVAATIEALNQQNLKLSTELESLTAQLAGLRQFEDTIKNAAIDARRNADLTISNAKKEADLILSRARTEAEEFLSSRARQLAEVEDQVTKLQVAKKSYLTKLRNLIKSHLEVLEEVAATGPPAGSWPELEVIESADVTRKRLETIATPHKEADTIKVEQANAPDRVIAVEAPTGQALEQPAPETAPQTTAEQPPEETSPAIDPELMAALEKYQKKHQPPKAEAGPPAAEEPLPAPGQIVETTARAEDIPHGFITPEMEKAPPTETDEVDVVPGEQDQPTEHNTIAMDAAPDSGKDKKDKNDEQIPPEKLAEELDRVVAKFEEEMSKADKS